MAKRAGPKGGGKGGRKKAEPAPEAVKPSETRKVINEKDFAALAQRCRSHQNQVSESSGSMGELIKSAADEKNLHRAAFADWRKLMRKGLADPAKLTEQLAHFDYYRTLKVKFPGMGAPMSLDDIVKEQGQMFARTEAGETDEDEADEDDKGTPAGETDPRPRFQTHQGGRAASAAEAG